MDVSTQTENFQSVSTQTDPPKAKRPIGRPPKFGTEDERSAFKKAYKHAYYVAHYTPTGRKVGRPKKNKPQTPPTVIPPTVIA